MIQWRSFFLAGFECSTHVRSDGVRLDLLASTEHDRCAAQDYAQLGALGLRTARDGLRWHLIDRGPGLYDWSSWLPMLRAAQALNMQVIWDLCHYGWPDDVDIWSGAFIDRFARYAGAVARLARDESDAVPFYCPINEISFWAWAGGERAYINPLASERGNELKRQLVRAYIAAVESIRAVDPRARFIIAEPAIHVEGTADTQDAAQAYRLAQFEVHDMLTGRLTPALGGRPAYLDIVGVNFYPHNQWYLGGSTIPLGHHAYRPFREMLLETQQRYQRPMFISETGSEGSARPYWLHHVCAEVAEAMNAGAQVCGICLYPILDYHGWDNDRVCRVGLLSFPERDGTRAVYQPLLEELWRQQASWMDAGKQRRAAEAV